MGIRRDNEDIGKLYMEGRIDIPHGSGDNDENDYWMYYEDFDYSKYKWWVGNEDLIISTVWTVIDDNGALEFYTDPVDGGHRALVARKTKV